MPQSLSVDLVLLRASAPDLALTLGRTLAARVVERGQQNVGILNLAGAILTAELPDDVRAGDRLRLVVQEATPSALLLQIAQPRELPPSAQPPAPLELHLPGGRRLAVLEREGSGAGGAQPTTSAVRSRCATSCRSWARSSCACRLDAVAARVQVTLPATALELGERACRARCGRRCRRQLGRPAEVALVPRRDPLDVYV